LRDVIAYLDELIATAGPGTGKSFAMKRRVARLLENGTNPSSFWFIPNTSLAIPTSFPYAPHPRASD
jgi:hypothetical protein